MGLYNRRNGQIMQIDATSGHLKPVVGASVVAYPVGAQVTSVGGSGYKTIYVRSGHGFSAGQRYLKNPGTDNVYSGTDTVQSVTDTTIVMGTSQASLVAGDVLFNLGVDTGVSAPDLHESPVNIYADMACSGTPISWSTVSTDTGGYYGYFINASAWELVYQSIGGSNSVTGYQMGAVDKSGSLSSGAVTDNAIARYDGTSGNALQSSLLIVDDAGAVTGATNVTSTVLTASSSLTSPTATVTTLNATTVAATTVTGANVTSGANPGHTHDGTVTIPLLGITTGRQLGSILVNRGNGTLTILEAFAICDTAPVTNPCTVNIKKLTLATGTDPSGTGTTILSGDISIAAAQFMSVILTSSTTPAITTTTVPVGDALVFDIDALNSAADIAVVLKLKRG